MCPGTPTHLRMIPDLLKNSQSRILHQIPIIWSHGLPAISAPPLKQDARLSVRRCDGRAGRARNRQCAVALSRYPSRPDLTQVCRRRKRQEKRPAPCTRPWSYRPPQTRNEAVSPGASLFRRLPVKSQPLEHTLLGRHHIGRCPLIPSLQIDPRPV